MSLVEKNFLVVAVPAALVLASASLGTGMASAGGSQAVRCEIKVTERGSSIDLEGVVIAKSEIRGSYDFSVSKSGGGGSSDIHQSGDFRAGPGNTATLGTVSLGGNGGSYVAKLKVLSDGRAIECRERVGGDL
jgi:hypothetical protein